jgi:hypothetical protein
MKFTEMQGAVLDVHLPCAPAASRPRTIPISCVGSRQAHERAFFKIAVRIDIIVIVGFCKCF